MMEIRRFRWGLLLLMVFAIYSSATICMKMGAGESFLSIPFIAYYCATLLVLSIYAILWQVVLKKISLHKAYLAKSSTIIFTTLIAALLFNEPLTTHNLIGEGLILVGLILLYTR